MSDALQFRKNKINLEDYNYEDDIRNRLILSRLTQDQFEILEEILYSPLVFPISSLSKSLEITEKKTTQLLESLMDTRLFSIEGDLIKVDKEQRKYFENQLVKFEEDFTPGLDFLQNQLKKVPIHVLPTWYQIPRTSNNIFESLVEKYLITPQVFQRYLQEVGIGETLFCQIVDDVFSSKELKICSTELCKKYDLTDEAFEKLMLQLEFNLICCLKYEKIDGKWCEVVMPFHEWREYLLFMRNAIPQTIPKKEVSPDHESEFAFVEVMTSLLTNAPVDIDAKLVEAAKQKLLLLDMATLSGKKLIMTKNGEQWLGLEKEQKAHHLFKHPSNKIDLDPEIVKYRTERNILEVEKNLAHIVNSGWVYFDDFISGTTIAFGEEKKVQLKKTGRSWRYAIPSYNGRLCFRITSFGKVFFA